MSRHFCLISVFTAGAISALFLMLDAQAEAPNVLRIGSSSNWSSSPGTREDAAIKTLETFIKDETGLANDIRRQKDWREVAAMMAKGDLQLGVFQGYELAWAQEKYPQLKPLALAVNIYPYSVVYIVERKNRSSTDFADLKGKAISLAKSNQPYVNLYLDDECRKQGAKENSFFSKTETPDNIEDALDDVIDGKVQAAAADRAALEAYKRRKPGRFNQLKPLVQSAPFPPGAVAYYDSKVDGSTLQRLRNGLLNADKKERGQTMLTLFHLTRFDPVPADFEKVLAQTRQSYPPVLDQNK